MGDLSTKIQLLPVILPVLIGSLVLHELAHGVTAHLLGDPTPKSQGRLTLNPIKHLDVAGSIFFLITFLLFPLAFGWAKPVQVDTRNLSRPKLDMAIVALAGPVTNILIAIAIAAFVFNVNIDLGEYGAQAISYAYMVNIGLAVFNMLPIPPLDGSRVIGAFMPNEMYRDWQKLDQYAPLIFLVVFLFLWGPIQVMLRDVVTYIDRFIIQLLL
jgi:Zn-dependent protease